TADGETIVARDTVTLAVYVVDISRGRIDSRMQHAAQQRVDGTEFGSWLRTIAVADYDAGGGAVQNPSIAAIGRPVQHVVNVLRSARSGCNSSLEQTVNGPITRIDSEPVAWIHKPS